MYGYWQQQRTIEGDRRFALSAVFEKRVIPCVVNEVISWHLQHGWVWDVTDLQTGDRVAVFYCTLLCGDGLILHFATVDGVRLSAGFILSTFRKGIRMVQECCSVLYATVPAGSRLHKVICRLGFVVCRGGSFFRDGVKIDLLKYSPGEISILS